MDATPQPGLDLRAEVSHSFLSRSVRPYARRYCNWMLSAATGQRFTGEQTREQSVGATHIPWLLPLMVTVMVMRILNWRAPSCEAPSFNIGASRTFGTGLDGTYFMDDRKRETVTTPANRQVLWLDNSRPWSLNWPDFRVLQHFPAEVVTAVGYGERIDLHANSKRTEPTASMSDLVIE